MTTETYIPFTTFSNKTRCEPPATTDEELTKYCKTIFGSIVVKAYFDAGYYSENIQPDVTIKNNEINWGAEHFIVEFINGAKVFFSNSEWAYLERLHDADSQQA